MHEALFAPLGMTRTALIYNTRFADNVADRIDLNGRFRARSAGSMTSSAEEFAPFAAALLAGKLLKPATPKVMLTPYIKLRSLPQFPLAANEPEDAEATATVLPLALLSSRKATATVRKIT